MDKKPLIRYQKDYWYIIDRNTLLNKRTNQVKKINYFEFIKVKKGKWYNFTKGETSTYNFTGEKIFK